MNEMTQPNRIIPNSIDEALAAWDAGDEVQTVEMGGMGEGYEMAIQCVAFELMRAIRDEPDLRRMNAETPDNGEFPQAFKDRLDEIARSLDPRDPETGRYKLGGLCGARVGAAKNIAVKLSRHGYQNARENVPDRLIFVRKQDPTSLYEAEQAALPMTSDNPDEMLSDGVGVIALEDKPLVLRLESRIAHRDPDQLATIPTAWVTEVIDALTRPTGAKLLLMAREIAARHVSCPQFVRDGGGDNWPEVRCAIDGLSAALSKARGALPMTSDNPDEMLSAWTPGPWMDRNEAALHNGQPVRAVAADVGPICKTVAYVPGWDEPETIANARLIAAAPCLAEALIELDRELLFDKPVSGTAAKAFAKARAALSRLNP